MCRGRLRRESTHWEETTMQIRHWARLLVSAALVALVAAPALSVNDEKEVTVANLNLLHGFACDPATPDDGSHAERRALPQLGRLADKASQWLAARRSAAWTCRSGSCRLKPQGFPRASGQPVWKARGAVTRSPETWSDPRGWEAEVHDEPLITGWACGCCCADTGMISRMRIVPRPRAAAAFCRSAVRPTSPETSAPASLNLGVEGALVSGEGGL